MNRPLPNQDTQSAWRYHDGTKHPHGALMDPWHSFDPMKQPLPFKIYTDLDPIPLPAAAQPLPVPALGAISSAVPPPAGASIPDLDAIARILHFSAGITKKIDYPWGPMLFRAAACTGALYHIELYLVCGDLPSLEAGVYHYGSHDSALRQLRRGDYRGVLVEASGNSPTVAEAPRRNRLHRRLLAQRLQVPGQGVPPRLLGLRHHPGQRSGHVLRTGDASPGHCRVCRRLRQPAAGPGP